MFEEDEEVEELASGDVDRTSITVSKKMRNLLGGCVRFVNTARPCVPGGAITVNVI